MTVKEITSNQKLAYWYDHIRTQRESGMSVKKYCEGNGLTPSTFYEYLKKIRQLLCDEVNSESGTNEAVSFVSLIAPSPPPVSDDRIIITKGKIRVEFESGTDFKTAESVIRALLC